MVFRGIPLEPAYCIAESSIPLNEKRNPKRIEKRAVHNGEYLYTVKVGVLIRESIRMSWQAVRLNKLRSLLSVLGITIGIFCVVAVYSLVHSLIHFFHSLVRFWSIVKFTLICF